MRVVVGVIFAALSDGEKHAGGQVLMPCSAKVPREVRSGAEVFPVQHGWQWGCLCPQNVLLLRELLGELDRPGSDSTAPLSNGACEGLLKIYLFINQVLYGACLLLHFNVMFAAPDA